MRLQTLLGFGAGIAALCQFAVGTPLGDATEPEIVVDASFPESEGFGQVVNGQRNTVFLTVENKSDRNITLETIAGSLHNIKSEKLVKNLTATPYKIPILEGAKIQLPYQFFSEFKPGDYKLNIWLNHVSEGNEYRVPAYEAVVTVVEPEGSWFDWQLWTTYAIVLASVGALGHYTYLTFAPQPKKRKAPVVSAPVTVTATGAGGYQEEWIPEHHLRKPKARKGDATGEETSGTELSGTEGRKRKGKK